MILLVFFAPVFHGQSGPLDGLELCLAPLIVVIVLLVDLIVPSTVNAGVVLEKTAKITESRDNCSFMHFAVASAIALFRFIITS